MAQATDNTLRLIKLANPGYEVPVAMGAAKPLTREWAGPVSHVHGNNGIGDVELPASEQQALSETAAEFIVRKANECNGELVLVTLGRLTNLAEALQLDPELPRKLKHVYTMGGTAFAPGNVTPRAEVNFRGDPEAVAAVFQSGLRLTMVGLDVTMKVRLTQQHLDAALNYCRPENKPIIQYMSDALQHYFRFYWEVDNMMGACPTHDPLTVLVARPWVVRTQTMKAAIETEGEYCAGSVVADLRTKPSVGNLVEICVDVDAEKIPHYLLSVF
ncbi:nucleoside hydrolase [Brevibacillus composti]|uniref:Nucleoside hydrolase n=1 Tax=Brevibacillus composti TaxID=2796470 RepID=A0A7T5EMR1_9BACL|nr:nucleoside hydrolase [Brevibacillus composti]QQE75412.1 nucleoside hydrolase [Brevibacillus composti]QUO42438.1 nucleoside hydrolase [Brevibacillus composti]